MLQLDLDRLTTAERDAAEAIRWREGDDAIEESIETAVVTIAGLRLQGRSDESIAAELMGRGHDFRHEYDPSVYLVHKAIVRQLLAPSEALS